MNEEQKRALDELSRLLKVKDFLARHREKNEARINEAVRALVLVSTPTNTVLNPAWVTPPQFEKVEVSPRHCPCPTEDELAGQERELIERQEMEPWPSTPYPDC